jgi:Cu-Zn family superoxide dismutase
MNIRPTIVLTAAGLSLTEAAPASTPADADDHAIVPTTTGEFDTLPGGTDSGYDVEGRAAMIRLPHRTLVSVHVEGLDADTTYPAHVHNAPCSAIPAGGGHYQHEVGGTVDAVNEIWPIVTTDQHGRGHAQVAHAHRARPEAQSIVIHYPLDTSIRLACVDLT